MSSRYWQRRSEGGHARGHSNMAHRDYTSDVKDGSRLVRRRGDVEEVREQLADIGVPPLLEYDEMWARERGEVYDWTDWRCEQETSE